MKSKIFACLIAVQIIALCVFGGFIHQKSVYWKVSDSMFIAEATNTIAGKDAANKINKTIWDFVNKTNEELNLDYSCFRFEERVNSSNLSIMEITIIIKDRGDDIEFDSLHYELWVVFDKPDPSIVIQKV